MYSEASHGAEIQYLYTFKPRLAHDALKRSRTSHDEQNTSHLERLLPPTTSPQRGAGPWGWVAVYRSISSGRGPVPIHSESNTSRLPPPTHQWSESTRRSDGTHTDTMLITHSEHLRVYSPQIWHIWVHYTRSHPRKVISNQPEGSGVLTGVLTPATLASPRFWASTSTRCWGRVAVNKRSISWGRVPVPIHSEIKTCSQRRAQKSRTFTR